MIAAYLALMFIFIVPNLYHVFHAFEFKNQVLSFVIIIPGPTYYNYVLCYSYTLFPVTNRFWCP